MDSFETRLCEFCCEGYEPKRASQRFCSTACKDGYHNRRKRLAIIRLNEEEKQRAQQPLSE